MTWDAEFETNDNLWEREHRAAGEAAAKELDDVYRMGLAHGKEEAEEAAAELAALLEASGGLTQGHGATVVRAAETLWAAIQARHTDTPDAVIITGMGAQGDGWLRLGHHRARTWAIDEEGDATRDARVTEIFISGECLAAGARQVLSTLLHEAAHGIAHVRGVQDTSRQGRYHNRRFVAIAEEVGLTTATEAHPVIGWSHTEAGDDVVAEYAKELEAVEQALTAARIPCALEFTGGKVRKGGTEADPTDPPKKKSGMVKMVCACEQPNIIRASRKVAASAAIRCDDCDTHFKEAE